MSEEPQTPLLSESQRRIAGFSLTLVSLVAAAAAIILVFVALARFVSYFSGVLWPLAVAGVLALVLRPLVETIGTRWKLRRLPAVLLIYAVFLLLFTVVMAVLLPPLVGQVIDFISSIPDFWKNGRNYFETNYPEWIASLKRLWQHEMVQRIAKELIGESKTLVANILPSLQHAGWQVMGVFGLFTHLAIIPVYLFFFLLSRGEPRKIIPSHLPFLSRPVGDDVVYLVREFIATVETFFRGQLIIALIMGAMLALGFSLVGLKFGLFIGLALGVLNVVPYLGMIVGISLVLPLAFLQPAGGLVLAGLVLLVIVIVQNIEGWILTPKIMGDRTGLHPVAIMVAILFWGTVFDSLLGMLFAIPLTAFFVTAWRLVRRKYT